MLQRIQTIFMFVVIVTSGVVPFLVKLYANAVATINVLDKPVVLAMYIISALLSVIAILQFKDRKKQFVFNRLNMLLNLIILGVFVYWSLTLSGESQISEKGIGMFLPIISIVFLVLANRAIKKDEDLVKSVDRLR